MDERAIRYRCDQEAVLVVGTRKLKGRVLELSASGAFFETTHELQYGAALRLYVDLPGASDPFNAEVEVTRLGKGQFDVPHPSVENLTVLREGIGLRFTKIPADEEARLLGFLELLDER